MNYSFSCPVPCRREIRVQARNDFDAIEKIILAGGMGCRNGNRRYGCDQAGDHLSPMSHEELRRIVGLCMREEQEAAAAG